MKRTPLRRKTPLKPARAMRKRRRTKHQERNEEHRDYVAWLHTRPCAGCRTSVNIQAAHVGQGGTGMKHGGDDETIPLCGPGCCDCHADHDQRRGKFGILTRAELKEWDAWQIELHRARYLASQNRVL